MTSESITERSPRLIARIAGLFYVVVFVLGILSLIVRGRTGFTAGMIAGGFYIAVTVLFYFIFKPVNRSLSLLAAVISLAGLSLDHWVNSLTQCFASVRWYSSDFTVCSSHF